MCADEAEQRGKFVAGVGTAREVDVPVDLEVVVMNEGGGGALEYHTGVVMQRIRSG